MPGLTTTAVVMLWVMFGLGLLGALSNGFFVLLRPELLRATYPAMGSMVSLIMGLMAVQALIWAVARGFLAYKITKRSARARTATFAVEAVGMAFQVAFTFILFRAFTADLPETGSFRFSFDCTGIVVPILVICFMANERSRQWCDR
jgi:hypothetical protein